MRSSMGAVVRVMGLTAMVVATSCSTAFAAAGAPDPSFGSRGLVALPQRSTATAGAGVGSAIVLPDGGVLLPTFRSQYVIKNGEFAGVRSRSLRFTWLRPNGSTARVSAPIVLPTRLGDTRVLRTGDGHLLLIGGVYGARFQTASLYVLRMSAAGRPEAAPGSSRAAVNVPVSRITALGSGSGQVETGAISISAGGRVFVVLRKNLVHVTGDEQESIGYGPLVVAAVDPSVGLARSFAGGAVAVAPAFDTRSNAVAATAVDDAGRLIVLVRSTKVAIGGTAQDVYVRRYDAAGALDATFGGGRVDVDGARIDTAYDGAPAVAVMRNGDVVTRLDETTESASWLAYGTELQRFLPTGEPSPTFGTAGRATFVRAHEKVDHHGFSSSSSSSSLEQSPALLEQPDGKLVVETVGSYRYYGRASLPEGVLRTTPTGGLDTTYERDGIARLDAPWSGGISSEVAGLDAEGRVVATISADYGEAERQGVIRLLAGDQPAPRATAQLRIDNRTCGATIARACFDANGSARITGRVLAGGRGVFGADVVVEVARPATSSDEDDAPALRAVRTGAGGRFSVPITRGVLLPGSWRATARVLATPRSQRVDTTKPVFFTLGPRSDIAQLGSVRRAKALASAIDYVVDDSIGFGGSDDGPSSQCPTLDACFAPSPQLRALVSVTGHPAPGAAGLFLRTPGSYTVVTRARLAGAVLEFVVTQTPDDTVRFCRGDAAARKHWCPGGTWDDSFDDPFVAAGIDGDPFDF